MTASSFDSLMTLLALPDGIITVDAAQRITFVNPAAARLLHLDADQVVGQPVTTLPDSARLFGTAEYPPSELIVDGEHVLFRTTTLPDDGLLITLRDSQAVIHDALDTDDVQLNIACFSHAVMTPLTSILSYLDILSKGFAGPLNDDQQEFIGVVARKMGDLRSLFMEIQTWVALNRGYIDIHPERVLIMDMISKAANKLESRFIAHQIGLHISGNGPIAMVDKFWTVEVVTHLLNNAIDGTPHGGSVQVRLSYDTTHVYIAIEDSNTRLEAGDIKHIFRPFRGLSDLSIYHHDRTRTYLELAIAHDIIQQMGGTLTATVVAEQGMVWHIALPRADGDE